MHICLSASGQIAYGCYRSVREARVNFEMGLTLLEKYNSQATELAFSLLG